MAAVLSKPTVERLGKLVPLLGSNQTGEVAAAAAAIERTLRTTGADWHDLVATLSAPPSRRQRREVVPPEERSLRMLEHFIELQRKAMREQLDRIEGLQASLESTKLDVQRTRLVQLIAARGVSKKLDVPQSLTPKQRQRQSIAATITSEPDLSDRAIARRFGASPSTVGSIRRQVRGG